MENISILVANEIMTVLAVILIVGMIFSKFSNLVKLPDVVLYVVAGIIIGPSVLGIVDLDSYPSLNQLILTFGSAYILYDGGREVNLKILNQVKLTVGLLAVLGIAISSFCIGLAVMLIFKIPFIYALLIGAVISSTDPASLVPIFKEISIKKRVKQTVISESAFNDAAGAILVFSLIGIIESGQISLADNAVKLVVMIAGGILAGVAVGLLFSMSISDGKYGLFHEFAPIVSIVAVILSYMLAEHIHGSGYMATFVTGLLCGNKKRLRMWVPNDDFEIQTHVRETMALIMRISIFVLLGTHVDFVSLLKYWKESLAVVLIMVVFIRPLSVIICTSMDRKTKWMKNEVMFMMWVRETGVIPAALSGMIMSMGIAHKDALSSVVFTAVFITLGIQASTTKFVARKLGVLEDVERKMAA